MNFNPPPFAPALRRCPRSFPARMASFLSPLILLLLLASLGGIASAADATETNAATAADRGARPGFANRPSVGLEGTLETNLPGTLLAPRPVDPRSPILVRIAEARPHGTLIAYDLRYVGLEPGRHDLRDHLVRVDGSSTNDLPSLPVEVASVLPPRHDGLLIPVEPSRWRRLGGYRVGLVMLGTLWVLALIPLLLKTRPAEAPRLSAEAPAPTLADRMRPLVEAAAAGRLDTAGKATLERLLLGHWREKLELGDTSMAESLARLREHPEGGELLRSLERWLHQRPGRETPDLEKLLAPYRQPGPGPGLGAPGPRPVPGGG